MWGRQSRCCYLCFKDKEMEGGEISWNIPSVQSWPGCLPHGGGVVASSACSRGAGPGLGCKTRSAASDHVVGWVSHVIPDPSDWGCFQMSRAGFSRGVLVWGVGLPFGARRIRWSSYHLQHSVASQKSVHLCRASVACSVNRCSCYSSYWLLWWTPETSVYTAPSREAGWVKCLRGI